MFVVFSVLLVLVGCVCYSCVSKVLTVMYVCVSCTVSLLFVPLCTSLPTHTHTVVQYLFAFVCEMCLKSVRHFITHTSQVALKASGVILDIYSHRVRFVISVAAKNQEKSK